MINKDIIISNSISLLDSLKIMNETNRKLLIVCEGKKFLGVISIGDIQRAILKKQDLSLSVSQYVRKKVTFALKSEDMDKVKSRMREEKIESMPVVDEEGNLCDLIEWNQLFTIDEKKNIEHVNLPVVIMAGGKGTRLLPLTNVIPKPLIPISDKTIIEVIMEKFSEIGSERFIISVNYMTEIIKEFFANRKQWNVEFIQEKKPLGTGGSLYLLKGKVKSTFFLTNCDTLVDIDLNGLVDYHKRNNNIITIVSAVKTIHIPYGTIETGIDGIVNSIREKPDYIYQVNSGFYVMEPEVLDYIEDEKYINVPDLISMLIRAGERVGAFPISEKSWIDMGNWDEYLCLVNKYLADK